VSRGKRACASLRHLKYVERDWMPNNVSCSAIDRSQSSAMRAKARSPAPVANLARILAVEVSTEAAAEIARRARGTPRIAGRLLRRVRDFALVDGDKAIDRKSADKALAELEVDAGGLDAMDRRYLSTIALNYGGGPVGVDTIAAALSEPRDAIEDIIEPYLNQKGFIQRTPRGRLLTGAAFRHLGLAEPARDASQFGLFAGDEDE